MTIQGVSAAGVTANCVGTACAAYPAAKGEVTLSTNSGATFYSGEANVTVNNIAFTNTGTTYVFRNGASGFVGN